MMMMRSLSFVVIVVVSSYTMMRSLVWKTVGPKLFIRNAFAFFSENNIMLLDLFFLFQFVRFYNI